MKEQYMRIKQAKIQHYALAASVHTKKPRKKCLRGCAAGGARRAQWWNRRMWVIAIAMPYLSQVSMTLSSRIEPPLCAM